MMVSTLASKGLVMAEYPLVSCIIPTKDRHDKVVTAINSVLSQDYPSIEVIVVDDGSSVPFAWNFACDDGRVVRIIRIDKSLGGAKARNLGVNESTGIYFCFLDDDDEYLPGKLKSLVGLLNAQPESQAAVGEILIVNAITGEIFENEPNLFCSIANTKKNKVHTNSTIIRSSIKHKITFLETLDKFQDTQFNTELCYKFNVIYTPKPVALWNVEWSSNQITNVKKPFRDTRNYSRLLKYFILDLKIPLKYLYWHVFKLFTFVVRFK